MSSSDGRRPAGRSGSAAEPSTGTAAGRNGTAAGAGQHDPWFEPGPKAAGPAGNDGSLADSAAGEAEPDTAQWFLRAGRAGLLPDSVSVDEPQSEAAGSRAPAAAGSAPPWAGVVAGEGAGSPPPWETGPWPGPGGERPSRLAGGPGAAAAPGGPARAAPPESVPAPAAQPAPGASWPARRVLVAGLVPLVIPGLVAGFAGLRGSRPGQPVRRACIAAIAASAAWAVIIAIAVVALGPGGSAATCSYPAAVHQAYSKAMTDLGSGAPAAAQTADLSVAVSRANASAAAAGQIRARNALFEMAGDLEQARADVTARQPVPAALRTRLAADGTALAGACSS